MTYGHISRFTQNPILAVPSYNVTAIKDIHTDLDASYPESLTQSKPATTKASYPFKKKEKEQKCKLYGQDGS